MNAQRKHPPTRPTRRPVVPQRSGEFRIRIRQSMAELQAAVASGEITAEEGLQRAYALGAEAQRELDAEFFRAQVERD